MYEWLNIAGEVVQIPTNEELEGSGLTSFLLRAEALI